MKKPDLFLLIILLTIGCASLREERQEEKKDFILQEEQFLKSYSKLLIDDFDAGVKPNLLGGDFGAWDATPEDTSEFCKIEFTRDENVGKNSGYSIKIIYDIGSSSSAANGFWMKLNNADFSKYKKLCFSVKGDTTTNFTKMFLLELKNDKGETGRMIVRITGDTWQEFKIPLRAFRGISNFSKMKEFVIVFKNDVCDIKKGVLYLDNVYVEK